MSVDPDDECAEGVFLPVVLTDQIGGVDVQSIFEEFDSFDLIVRKEPVQIAREPALGLLGEGGGQHALTHRSPHLEFPMEFGESPGAELDVLLVLLDLTVDTPEEAVKPGLRLRGPRLSTHRLDGCLLGVRHRRQAQGQDLFEDLETGVLVEVGQCGEEDVPVVVEDLQDVLVVLILEDQTPAQGWAIPNGFLGQGDRKAKRCLDVPGSGFARGRCVGPDVDGVFVVKRWLDALPGGVEDDRMSRHLCQAGEGFGVGRLGSCLCFEHFAVFVLERADHPRHNHIRR